MTAPSDPDPIGLRLRAEAKVEAWLAALRAGQAPPLAELLAPGPEAEVVRDLLEVLISRGDEARRRLGWPARYRIAAHHARGGFGRVLQALDTQTGSLVALKIAAGHVSAAQRERWRREATVAHDIVHRGICRVLDHDVEGDPPFVVMAFEAGETLQAWSEQQRPFQARTAIQPLLVLIAELAEAAQALHDAKIVHRDIKPANIIRRDDGSAVLVDLGLARSVDAETKVTATWQVPGTPGFIAPECLRGAEPTAAADVWSIGATLFACLTGTLLLDGQGETQLQQARDGSYLRNLDAIARFDRDLHTVLSQAVAVLPSDRYPTAAALADDLRRVAEGQVPLALPQNAWVRTRRWMQRNPGPTRVGSVLAVMAGLSTFLWLRADRAFASADRERQQLIAMADEMLESEALVRDLPGAIEFRAALAKPAVRMLEQIEASDAAGRTIDRLALAQRQFRLAEILLRGGQLVPARRGFEQVLARLAELPASPARDQVRIAAHAARAELAERDGNPMQAVADLDAALATVPAPSDPAPDALRLQVARALRAQARRRADADQTEQAWELLALAGRHLRAVHNQDHADWRLEFLDQQEQIATLLTSGLRAGEAKAALEAAAAMAADWPDAGVSGRLLRARFLSTRATILQALERPEEARTLADAAIRSLRELAQQAPDDLLLQARLTQALVAGCGLARAAKDQDHAWQLIEEASRRSNPAFELQLGRTDAVILQSSIHERAAQVHRSREHHAAARERMRQALAELDRMPADDPRRPMARATILQQLGHLCLLTGDLAEAERLLREGIQSRRQAMDRLGPTPDSRRRLANIQLRLAMALMERDHLISARELSDAATTMLAALAEELPESLSIRINLIEALSIGARIEQKADNATTAIRGFRAAAAASDPTRWTAREVLRLHVAAWLGLAITARDADLPEVVDEATRAARHWFARMPDTRGTHEELAFLAQLVDFALDRDDHATAIEIGTPLLATANTRAATLAGQPLPAREAILVHDRLVRAHLMANDPEAAAPLVEAMAARIREFRSAHPDHGTALQEIGRNAIATMSACLATMRATGNDRLRPATIAIIREAVALSEAIGGTPLDLDTAIRSVEAMRAPRTAPAPTQKR